MNDNALIKIEQIASETKLSKLEGLPEMQRTIKLANGMRELRKLLSGDVLNSICELADTNLGFRTDKANGKPYPKEVIRDVLIEAMIRGAQPIGNEFNIISGRCYLTKEYYERMLRDIGIESLRVQEGVPQSRDGGALVPMRATWRYRGQDDDMQCTQTAEGDNRIPVRVNSGMGVDAILGKAYRKLYARIYRRATGSTWLEAEEPEAEEVGATVAEVPAVTIDWDEIWLRMSDCELLSDVNRVVADVREAHPAMVDTDVFQLESWAEQRCDNIRATRGAKSNQ